MERCFRAKKILSKIDCKLFLRANLTKLICSLYLTPRGNFYLAKRIFKKFWLVSPVTLQINLYDQNLMRKKRTQDLILSIINNFKEHRNSNTKRVCTFLKLYFVFLCCVQGVLVWSNIKRVYTFLKHFLGGLYVWLYLFRHIWR